MKEATHFTGVSRSTLVMLTVLAPGFLYTISAAAEETNQRYYKQQVTKENKTDTLISPAANTQEHLGEEEDD